jgi:tetratricopeptide (TPR) repeat protein
MNDPADAALGQSSSIRRRTWDVFISYAPQDTATARALGQAIEARGFTTWIDSKLDQGEQSQAIEQALRSSGAVIVLLSAASLSSRWVSHETDVALDALPHNAVLPVAVGEVDVHATPPWLNTRKWLYLRDDRRVDKLVDQLLPTLEGVLGSHSSEVGRARIIGELPPRTPLVGVVDYLHRLLAQRTGITWVIGQPGIGKTKLAREYAFQVRNEMDFICWLSGSFASNVDLEQQLRRIEEEAAPDDRGLIVIDELDAVENVHRILLQLTMLSQRHRAVITARRIVDVEFVRHQNPAILTVGPLSQTDIANYLDTFASELPPQERAELARAAQSTGGSPLVLRLITHALQTHSIDSVLAAVSSTASTLGGALDLLLDRLSSDQRHRLDVLSFCSGFLSTVRSNERWNLPGDDALFARLIDWGLCATQADGTASFHQLVVEFLRAHAPRQAIEDALAYLAPRLQDPNLPGAQDYLSSVAELTDLAEPGWGPAAAGNLTELLIWQASVWRAIGQPERAEMLCPRALAMATESRGSVLRIRVLNLQSALAFDRGRIDEAKAIEERTADLAVNELGAEHPIAIASLANLATSHRAQGDLAEAITLLRRAVELGQRTLPEGHPDLMAAQTNLAVCLRDAGLAEDALMILSEANRHALNEGMGLQVNQILATVLMDMDRLEEAAAILDEVLSSMDRIGLSGTTEALTARANLATLYSKTGRLSDALTLQSDVLDQFDVIYGPDHPATLSAQNNYAGILAETGSLENATRLFSEVAETRTRVLGAEHPDTLQSWLRLARATSVQGNSSRALELYSDLSARVVRVLGPDHPLTLVVREEYARELRRTGDVVGARLAFRGLLGDLERVLPPDHPMTRIAATGADIGLAHYGVSYCTAPNDVAWGLWIAQALDNASLTVFTRQWYLRPGDDYAEVLSAGFASVRQIFIVVSSDYIKDKNSLHLIERAIVSEHPSARLIPVMIEDTELPDYLRRVYPLRLHDHLADQDMCRDLMLETVQPHGSRKSPGLFSGAPTRAIRDRRN